MLFLLALLLGANTAAWTGTQPRLARSGERVFLTFVRDNTIQVLQSNDGGDTFTERAAVPVAGKLSAGMRRGPRIAVTGKAVLVTGIAGTRGGGADGDVLVHRSTDDGRSWSAPTIVNDVAGAAREGMHGMAANTSGLVVVTWLDLRQRGTRIYAAISRDHGVTWSADVLAYQSPDGAVCECCHPSAAVSEDGRIAIMFRNHIGGDRDMYVTQSRDGTVFESAVKLGRGSWTLEACPMDGGDLDLASGQPTTAWRREDAIFLATPSAAERRIGTGRDPALAIAGAKVDVAWTGTDGLVLLREHKTEPLGPGRFPVLLAFDRYTLVAWENQGQVLVRRMPR
jgi:hypothetical protein